VPVPLVDGIQAAVTMAEGLVRINPRKPSPAPSSDRRPKESKGLAAPLANLIGHKDA